MVVRNLLNDTTVTAGGTMVIGGIGAGIYRPIRLEEVTNVTSGRFVYYRNGVSTGVFSDLVIYEGSVVDLSAMAAATQSAIEATKHITTGLDAIDGILMTYVESGTSKTITLRVLNASVANSFTDVSTGKDNLTDYGDGKFNYLDFIVTKSSPLTGEPFNHKIFYTQTLAAGSSVCGERPIAGGTTVLTPNGWSRNIASTSDKVILNAPNRTGIIGYVRYAKKYPLCTDRTKRVTLKWLNSKGLYDTMHFNSFRIQPTYQTSDTGGNRILSYDVTVNAVVTSDNEKPLYWLSRSADVQGVFPIDINQWARVTITNPNAFNTQGGSLGRTVSYKCKFEIVEP